MIVEHEFPEGPEGHDPAADSVQPQSAVQTKDAPRRILIVDDDPVQNEILEICFRKVGFDPATAENGETGINKARAIHPDLILVDIEMPGISGLEVCQELTDDSDTCDIPVIILSGSDESNIVRSSRAAGCKFFIHKPYDPNALLSLAHSAMEDRSSW